MKQRITIVVDIDVPDDFPKHQADTLDVGIANHLVTEWRWYKPVIVALTTIKGD